MDPYFSFSKVGSYVNVKQLETTMKHSETMLKQISRVDTSYRSTHTQTIPITSIRFYLSRPDLAQISWIFGHIFSTDRYTISVQQTDEKKCGLPGKFLQHTGYQLRAHYVV